MAIEQKAKSFRKIGCRLTPRDAGWTGPRDTGKTSDPRGRCFQSQPPWKFPSGFPSHEISKVSIREEGSLQIPCHGHPRRMGHGPRIGWTISSSPGRSSARRWKFRWPFFHGMASSFLVPRRQGHSSSFSWPPPESILLFFICRWKRKNRSRHMTSSVKSGEMTSGYKLKQFSKKK